MTGTAALKRPGQDNTSRSLTESLASVNSLCPRMRIYCGVPPGGHRDGELDRPWLHCLDLLTEPAHFQAWRAALADWLRATHGQAPERTVSGYILSWYLQVSGDVAGALFHIARRVPPLRPADLAFRLAPHRPHPHDVALLAPDFFCLPDDPAAGAREATVVADEQGLAAILRARFVAHVARFVAAFGPTTRFGRHTMWAAATDALDRGLWLAGRIRGDEGAGAADAALVLPDKLAPFTSGSTLRAISDDRGRTLWTRRRQSCCFRYALPDEQRPCSTCPRLDDAERTARTVARA